MASDFEVTIDGDIDDKVHVLPIVTSASQEAAEEIAEIARELAPVETGAYQNGIKVQKTKFGYRVFASDQKSAWIEFGIPSRGVAARFTLRRAVESSGYKFKKG
jgi:hypothetical protein